MYTLALYIIIFLIVYRSKDDLDFDEFLESVKARQQSMTTSKAMHMLSQSCCNAMKPQWNTADVIIPLMGDSLHTGPINHLPLYPLLGL